jgi:hypothetical protein
MVRREFFNQGLIDPDPVFNHDPDRGEKISIRVWKKKCNQRLHEFAQPGSGWKLSIVVLIDFPGLVTSEGLFRMRFFNQGPA